MFRKSRVIALVVGVAVLGGAAGAITSYASGPHGRGHGSPLALRAGPPVPLDTSGWRNAAEAQTSLAARNPESKAELGLTPAALASTRAIYTFPASTPVFGGVSFFEVSRPGEGSCFFMLGNGDCWAHPAAANASGALPAQVSVTDLDGPTGPVPIVLTGTVAPQVKAVTMTCFGTTYSATIKGSVVTWIAPSADMGAADCILRATLADGHVFSEQL